MLHTALTAVAFVAQVGLGVMFLWSAAGKVWEWSLFQSTIEGLGLTSTVAGPAAGLLIAAEFTLGALVAVGQYPAMATIGVLLLLVLFAIVGLYAEQRGLSLSCSCFGRARTKLGRTTVIRAVLLGIPTLLVGLSSRSGPSAWPTDSGPAAVVLLLCGLLLIHIHGHKGRAWSAP